MLLICYSTFGCKLHLMAILLQKIHTSVMTASLDASRISEFFRAVCVCSKVCLSLKQGMYFIWVLSIVIEKDKHTHRSTKRIIWTVASFQYTSLSTKNFPAEINVGLGCWKWRRLNTRSLTRWFYKERFYIESVINHF